MSETIIQDKIISLLKKRGELNILQLSSHLNMDRHTIAKYLEILKTKGVVTFLSKGKSKVWRISDSTLSNLLGVNGFISEQVLSVLKDLDCDVSIQSKNYDVIWHSAEEKKGKCYEVLKGKPVPCKNCPSREVFKTGISKKSLFTRSGVKKVKLFNPIKNEAGEVIAVIEITKNKVVRVD